MATRLKRISKRKRLKRSKSWRNRASRLTTAAAVPADNPEELLNEPAMPPPEPIVPVEEIPPPQQVEDTEACGLPDERQTRGADLH
jgi:hypothetical protein